MTLHLELPADVERALRARAAAEGKDVEAFVAEVVTERVADAEAAGRSRTATSHAEFVDRLRRIAAMHPGSGGHVDDSRESIYAGRGE